ncbi:hypothetical protein OUZ56_023889 [Daphnia magna]|uniref:Uncharacterized protein n=1 Tax=Daphnia magna TaxID=35525 RepID=A0ABR0AZS9_9CRUS|nr:hypothetical protein OUZ56_023889 [Daphnia magna]
MTVSMESMEPNLGEVEVMETDKTRDHLKAPTVPQKKRFKPTLTPQNSRPSLSTSQPKKPFKLLKLKIASINIGGIRDGNLNIVGLQEVAFHSCPTIESRYHMLSNVGLNKNGTAMLIRHGLDYSRLLLESDGRLISIDVKCFTFINIVTRVVFKQAQTNTTSDDLNLNYGLTRTKRDNHYQKLEKRLKTSRETRELL